MAGVGADHGPIEPAYHAMMNELSHALDEMFNGKGCLPGHKTTGFFLAVYAFDAPGRFNYISNSDKLDVRAMLKEITARIEARLSTEGKA